MIALEIIFAFFTVVSAFGALVDTNWKRYAVMTIVCALLTITFNFVK